MGYIRSELPMSAYLQGLRRVARPNFAFWDHYAAGIVIGRFFAVAYHSPYEWNRRITRECNRAWGYVREVDGRTEVNFIRGKGGLAPLPVMFMTLFCRLVFAIGSYDFPPGDGNGVLWLTSFAAALVIAAISAVQSCMTEAGEEGAGIVTMLLRDPEQFYYC